LRDDVARLRQHDHQPKAAPTILAAHSYRGHVIHLSASDAPKRRRLVYIAGFGLDEVVIARTSKSGSLHPAGGANVDYRLSELGLESLGGFPEGAGS